MRGAEMKLPSKFVDENVKKEEGVLIFGVPLLELSRRELIACSVAGWSAERQAREEGSKRLAFLSDLKR